MYYEPDLFPSVAETGHDCGIYGTCDIIAELLYFDEVTIFGHGYTCPECPMTITDAVSSGSITGTITIERYNEDTLTYTTLETRDASILASWTVDTYVLYTTYGPGTQDICAYSTIGYKITFNGDFVCKDGYGNILASCNSVNLNMSDTQGQAYGLPSVYLANCV